MNREKTLITITAVLFVLVLIVYGLSYLGSSKPDSPEQLADRALNGQDIMEKEQAASELASRGKPAEEQMVAVLGKTDEPGVRAAMLLGLGDILSYDHIDSIIGALGDDSDWVRVAAASALLKMTDINFPAREEPEIREQALKQARERWNGLRESKEFKTFVERKRKQNDEALPADPVSADKTN
jgi:HEAT repeat protein